MHPICKNRSPKLISTRVFPKATPAYMHGRKWSKKDYEEFVARDLGRAVFHLIAKTLGNERNLTLWISCMERGSIPN